MQSSFASVHIFVVTRCFCIGSKCIPPYTFMYTIMCKLERQTQTSQLHPGQLFVSKEKWRAALGGIRTHGTLQSRRPLYQLYTYVYTLLLEVTILEAAAYELGTECLQVYVFGLRWGFCVQHHLWEWAFSRKPIPHLKALCCMSLDDILWSKGRWSSF